MCKAEEFVPKVFHTQAFTPKAQAICKSLLCYLVSSGGETMKIRIILDSASELNLLKRNVADTLGLVGKPVILNMITTGGDAKVVRDQKEVSFHLRSLNGKFQSELMQACTSPEISDRIKPSSVNPRLYEHLKHLTFTEPLPQDQFVGKPHPFNQIQFQLLVGEPDYSNLLDENASPNPIKSQNPDKSIIEPSAMKTYLGYCLCGGYPKENNDNHSSDHSAVRLVKAKIFHTKVFKNPEQSFAFRKLASQLGEKVEDLDPDQKSLQEIQLLWNLDTIGIEANQDSIYTKEEEEALALMKKVTFFDSERRRWTTSLLWKDFSIKVNYTNESRALAVAKSLEKKYLKADAVLARYSNNPDGLFFPQINSALKEFLDNRFMTLATKEEMSMKKHIYYMQFHAVIEEARNTRIRVVLNAASKDPEGNSLNSHLYPGPVLLPNILDVLVAFRKNPTAFSCDLSKCYLRTFMDYKSQQYLRLKWRFGDLQDDFSTFVFRRLPFGISSAAFQSAYIIKANAKNYEDEFPESSQIIQNTCYVDDLVNSVENEQKCQEIISQIIQIFEAGGYKVHKFCSNSKKVMSSLPAEIKSSNHIQKILGCSWNLETDELIFPFLSEIPKTSKKDSITPGVITRRKALSITSQIFDPQGLLCPITLLGRNIIQASWKIPKLNWDDPLPTHLAEQVVDFQNQLPLLANLSLPRCLVKAGFKPKFLAAFSDGSDKGYACIIYLVSEHPETEIRNCRLVFGKSRATPVKNPLSTPKCELLGALLSIRSCLWIKKALKIDECHYFSDSQITLHRIRKNPAIFKAFVSNRLSEIRKHSQPESWHFCTSSENISADLGSRGTGVQALINCPEYWNGPKFLQDKSPWRELSAYTKELRALDQEELPPSRKFDAISKNVVVAGVAARAPEKLISEQWFSLRTTAAETRRTQELELFHRIFHRFESWRKSIRLFCRIFRFLNIKFGQKFQWAWNKSEPDQKRPRNHFIGYEEFQKTETFVFKMTQREHFFEELKILKSGKNFEHLPKTSQLKNLSPFIDPANDVIRLKSRVRFSDLICQTVDPIIMPKDSAVMRKWVRWIHITNNHAPTEITIAKCRFYCWIISSRRTIKKVLSFGCICRRFSHAKALNQSICPLPIVRLGLDYMPWRYVSCDYLGPIFTGPPAVAGQPAPAHTAHYVLLFSCLQTRAISLVLNHEMTADSFIQSIRSHVAKNGIPQYLLSDHQKNLHAADKIIKGLLRKLNWNNVKEKSNFTWCFSTELSPWKNACSETMVKLCKKSLRIMMRNATLDLYEVLTLLEECACLVNERSLSYISDDDVTETGPDSGPLTPNMLSKGRPAGLLPDLPYREKVENTPINKKLLHRRKMLNNFEKRWKSSYLSELSLAKCWRENAKIKIEPGLIVILKDDTARLSRGKWRLGRIIECFPSIDSKIRTVLVKVYNKESGKTSILRRSVQKLSVTEASLIQSE